MTVLDASTDIASSTVEDALLELLVKIKNLQSDVNTNPNGVSYVTSFTYNAITNTILANLSVPCTPTIGSNGELTLSATEQYS